jgi:hypothetical protein
LIKRTHEDRLVGHISRDSTAIEAREKPVQVAAPEMPKRKRGPPKKGEVVEKEPRRLERQATISLAEMIDDLPKGWSPDHCRLTNGLILVGVSDIWQFIVKGLVIVGAVALDRYRLKGSART